MNIKFILIFAFALFTMFTAMSFINVKDTAMSLDVECESKIADIENVHNTTFKNINQISQTVKLDVSLYDKYVRGFVEGRESIGQGSSWVWLSDNITQKDPTALANLQRIIENGNKHLEVANRNANFTISNYNVYVGKTINSLMIGSSYPKREIIQITSSRSQHALATGTDDNTDLNLLE